MIKTMDGQYYLKQKDVYFISDTPICNLYSTAKSQSLKEDFNTSLYPYYTTNLYLTARC